MTVYLDTARRVIRTEAEGLALLADSLGDSFDRAVQMVLAARGRVIVAAVAAGTGIAGCHGGMCDAFRENADWQFLTGSQWVAHPGNDGVAYRVRIVSEDALVAGIGDFDVKSEQYYLHVDPAVKVLAVTDFPVAPGPHEVNGPVAMPVAYVKGYGQGRVYYNSLGHQANVIDHGAPAEMLKRGLFWAARR